MKTNLINVIIRREIVCDRIENICFDVDLIAKGMLFYMYEPVLHLNSWKVEVRINI